MNNLFDFLSTINSSSFSNIYLFTVIVCCWITGFSYLSSSKNLLDRDSRILFFHSFLLSAFLIVLLGGRPERSFGDSLAYKIIYESALDNQNMVEGDKEIVWQLLMVFCNKIGLSVRYFFTFVSTLYISLMLMSCWLLMRNNTWVAMLFCVISFSFFSYGVNGIRNGLACSMVMFGLALFVQNDKIKKIIALLVFVLAYGTHNSTMLPIACIILSSFFIKSPKHAIIFWAVSIILSLSLGNLIGNFFADLGFDERTSYFEDLANADADEIKKFSQTGFRFDFLLYSSMPVLFVWYLTIKRNFNDRSFNIIANTYIIANAFWIMVIRATYSNRFAYLSWFLYPIVIAYPLLRMNIWDNQDRKTALFLFAYSGFTLFMFILGK